MVERALRREEVALLGLLTGSGALFDLGRESNQGACAEVRSCSRDGVSRLA